MSATSLITPSPPRRHNERVGDSSQPGTLARSRRAQPVSYQALPILACLILACLTAAGAEETARAQTHAAPAHPVRIAPVVHPATPGEGVWRPASFAVGGVTPVWMTSYRPDPSNQAVVAYVAWLDHTNTSLALYPGSANPPTATPRGNGAVPQDQRWRLLATFNGAFKWNAGPAGFVVNGHADEPLVRGLATVVAYPNGRVDIVSWRGPTTRRSLVLARQNLPLLVNHGRANALVADVMMWGATLGGGAAVWRSALGVDSHGDLLYVAADSQTPASLAALLLHVGAQRAIELDINPEWPTFNVYGKRGGRNPVKVVPNPQETAYRWLVPDSRDFFAVYTRSGGTALVPFG